MGIAANAVADLTGPPPRAPASAASENDPSAPSFQDHVDANDRPALRAEDPSKKSDAQTTQTESDDQSKVTTADTPHVRDDHSDSKADAAPLFLQLIANVVAPAANAEANEQTPQQQNTTPAPPVESQAQAAQRTLVAPPSKAVTKPEALSRSSQTKSAKDTTAKAEAAPIAADENASTAAPDSIELAAQDLTPGPIATALVTLQDAPNTDNAKSDAIKGAQSAPTPAAQPQQQERAQPRLAVESTQGTPEALTPLPNASGPKPRDTAKSSPDVSALKQAAEDFAPTTAKTPAAPSTSPALSYPQLTTASEQSASNTSDLRTQSTAAPISAQIGGEIIRRFNGQDTSFQLRLDPPDLGRVDVRLDVSRDHRVTAVISADNPQALSDLARGARDLQQALQSAGLDVAEDGLRFDLSSNGQGNSFAQAQAQQDQPNFRAGNVAQPETAIAPEIAASRPLSIDSWRGSRVDLVA